MRRMCMMLAALALVAGAAVGDEPEVTLRSVSPVDIVAVMPTLMDRVWYDAGGKHVTVDLSRERICRPGVKNPIAIGASRVLLSGVRAEHQAAVTAFLRRLDSSPAKDTSAWLRRRATVPPATWATLRKGLVKISGLRTDLEQVGVYYCPDVRVLLAAGGDEARKPGGHRASLKYRISRTKAFTTAPFDKVQFVSRSLRSPGEGTGATVRQVDIGKGRSGAGPS